VLSRGLWDSEGHHLFQVGGLFGHLDSDYRTLYITATSSVYKLRTKTRGFVPYLTGLKK